MKVAVIGGGAAGFFAALSCATHHPTAQVVLLEKSNKLLAKVKISGGGRCNVTHNCLEVSKLAKYYPRGEKFLKNAFRSFAVADTLAWFEQRGVAIKTEEDGRMFPTTDDSQTIIDCLLDQAHQLKVDIRLAAPVLQIKPLNNGTFALQIGKNSKEMIDSTNISQRNVSSDGKNVGAEKNVSSEEIFDKVVIASGGSPKTEGLQWLADLGHSIQPPVPSLFTFNIPNNPITQLMGVAVAQARVRIADTKLEQEGALLITHWGLSAYSILRLSAWGARLLAEKNYQFQAIVSWLATHNEEQLRTTLYEFRNSLGSRQMGNKNPFQLPNRLWEFLLQKINLDLATRWADLTKNSLNSLVNVLLYDTYQVQGKTTFKEEFVTCGGVDLSNIDYNTMQSKKVAGLYFAGEVMDIDGITGGFNFQAAWTTGYLAGKLGEK